MADYYLLQGLAIWWLALLLLAGVVLGWTLPGYFRQTGNTSGGIVRLHRGSRYLRPQRMDTSILWLLILTLGLALWVGSPERWFRVAAQAQEEEELKGE